MGAAVRLLSCLSFLLHNARAEPFQERRILRRFTNSSTTPPVAIDSTTTSTTTTVFSTTSAKNTTTSTTSQITTSSSSTTPDPPQTYFSTLTDFSASGAPVSSNLGCAGSTTYTNTIPQTIFLTVTQGYDVTLTATNAPFTAPAIFQTDQTACLATYSIPPLASGGGHPNPNNPQEASDTVPTESTAPADWTSTVYVTKKTPVPVVEQTSSAPPVFQQPSNTKTSHQAPQTSPPPPPEAPPATSKSVAVPEVATPKPVPAASAPASSPAPSPPKSPEPGVNPQPPSKSAQQSQQAASTHSGLDAQPAKPSPAPDDAVPSSAKPPAISVQPSSVVIGSHSVAIPTGTQHTTVQVAGNTYTVNSHQIVGPKTTVPISESGNVHVAGATAGPGGPPPMTTETAAGMTIAVGPTQAVISGHTYSIGAGATPTTITAPNGQTISIGPHGVGLASTTFAPLAPQPSGKLQSVVTDGGLIITLDSTQAVISGKTYSIGSGAAVETTVIGGQTVSLGPGGMGFASTTVNPATMTMLTATVTVALPTASGNAAAAIVDRDNIPLRSTVAMLIGIAGMLLVW